MLGVDRLSGRRVVVGVSGGIAAYKSAELVRQLRRAGCETRVVMTTAATRFITPLTLQALSGQRVITALLDVENEAIMGHIELARWAEAVLVAPASADLIARLAQGMADDALTAVCLATSAPLLVAPAMNRVMWAHPATQENCVTLRHRGASVLGPADGDQACGEVGAGRMLEPAQLVDYLAALWAEGPLSGCKVIVTAGPTREAIDPVRYIGNRSSGKMGYAVAAAAARAGAQVFLVSGPTHLTVPVGVARVTAEDAAGMLDAVMALIHGCDIFIGAAAVADYRPSQKADQKIKKKGQTFYLELVPSVDILTVVSRLPERPFTVGFAAETERLETHARDKLSRKELDIIAANDVGREGIGFDAEENELSVFWAGGAAQINRAPKAIVARELMALVGERYHEKSSG